LQKHQQFLGLVQKSRMKSKLLDFKGV